MVPALLILVFALSGCSEEEAPLGPASPQTGKQTWDHVGAVPLSRRTGPVVAWTGKEILVVGGDVGDPCPANASCSEATESAADGAAFNPRTETWRPIAAAPVTLPAYQPRAFVDGHLFVRLNGRLLDYDVAADQWATLPRAVSDLHEPVAAGSRLLLVSSSDEDGERADLSYDVAGRRWSALPEDPLGSSYNREVTPTPAGLVLTARALDSLSEENAPLLAAVLDGSGGWRRLPDGGEIGGGYWTWTGARMVSAMMQMDGSSDRPDGLIPTGGRLDPVTGTWSSLPDLPRRYQPGWPVWALGPQIASSGWVYDDPTGTWRYVPRPRGAEENPGPAVWADGTLYVVGSQPQRAQHAAEYDRGVWSWRVPKS